MPTFNRDRPAILDRVLQADRFRLTRQWQQLGELDSSDPRWQRWQNDAQASVAKCDLRAASIPQLQYATELPITAHRQQIIELLQTHQTLVICGETGSGKSTQLPKLLLDAGLGRRGMIGHTQPRRLAARAVATRVAEELSSSLGELVGFKIRFTDTTKPHSLIKLMTDGVLLAETQRDRFLDQYEAIIIDEAHERSLNIDFLLGYLKRLLERRHDLKLIITSATIDPQRFAEHFAGERGPAPIVEVSGRTYPVEVLYRPPEASELGEVDEPQMLEAVARATDELLRAGPGDILLFLPTEHDIRVASKHLRGHFVRSSQENSIELLPLYARLSQADQNKIFQRHNKRRIVLATNVAESSLTVPGIHYVIDTGLVRISRYAPRSKVQRLPIEAISQASANQRTGRCGRLGPGVCIRLYSRDDFESRSQFTTPEIRRSDLASVMLQSLALRLGPLEEYPLLDPPTPESIRDAQRTLFELQAVDERGQLTKLGTQLGKLPCDPRVGRMLLAGDQFGCLPEVLVIAAAIEVQDVRLRPAGQAPAADEAHAIFADPQSDFLSYLRLWDFYEHLGNELGRSRLQKALNQKFLSWQNFREWSDIVRQLKELLHNADIKVGLRKIALPAIDLQQLKQVREDSHQPSRKQSNVKSNIVPLKRPDGYASIHQALMTGLLSGIAHATDSHEYRAAGGLSVSLWPGSGLFRRKPKWVMAAELLETNRRYARTVAEIDSPWIEQAAAHLLKHTYSDPHWSSKSGAAMIYRRSTLYGLTVASGIRVPLATIDPTAARQLLIEHGLVAGEWNCGEKFYQHNCELLADLDELVRRTRQRDFIFDKYHLGQFYEERLAAEIVDLASLRNWLRKHGGTDAERALWMKTEDLVRHKSEVVHQVADNFPNELRIGATSLPLDYHFEPGHKADGVTITVPQAALRQISDESLGWLVPGLLEEKILHLIRSLPKHLRTNFVPAPDVARELAAKLSTSDRQRAFTAALCEAMTVHSKETVKPSDFDWQKLPEHLRFLVRVVDDDGQVVDAGRNVLELQARHALPESLVSADASTVSHDWKDRKIREVDFEFLPSQVPVHRGGLVVAAFPTLVDAGEWVEVRLADNATEAEHLSRSGWMRLFALKHHRQLRSQVAHLPQLEKVSVWLGHLLKTDELRNQLQDLIARNAFIEGQPLPTGKEGFEVRNLRSTESISIATQQVSQWLPAFAENLHRLRLRMEDAPQLWKEVFDDVRSQLDHILPRNFLSSTTWANLQEFPRYLRAIEMRIDKLKSGGLPKDRQLRAAVSESWNAYLKLVKRPEPISGLQAQLLDQLRWLIEEYRVSLFAQSLGTKQSVSPKRIQELIKQLESS